MALIPSQVLRVAILLSYFSILCHYKALDMPAHQTYGGSWKFLTFIDLVRFNTSFYSEPRGQRAASCRAARRAARAAQSLLRALITFPSLPRTVRLLHASFMGRERGGNVR